MKRLCAAFFVLALALPVAALANDFIKPTPVPSSRDSVKPAAKAHKTPDSWRNIKPNQKIVKTTKSGSTLRPTTATPPASLQ